MLEAFLDGDAYLAIADKRRFTTIDNQLNRVAEIIGDGRIDGWEIQNGTFPEVLVTLGSGIIDKFFVNTYGDTAFELSPNGTFYFFAQRKVGIIGTIGPKADVASISYSDSTAPATPQNLELSATASSVFMLWDDNTEVDLSHYLIERSDDGVTYEELATAPSSVYGDMTVDEDSTYYYKVYAVDLSGNQSSAVSASITTPESTEPPPNPIEVQVIEAEGAINVLWKHPPTLDESKRKNYRLTWAGLRTDYSEITPSYNPELSKVMRTLDPDSLQARIDDLSIGQPYRVVLQTIDYKDRISSGVRQNATPQPTPAPRDPINLQAVQSENIEGQGGVRVDLSWESGTTEYDPVESYRYKIYVSIDGQPDPLPIDVPLGDTEEQVTLLTYDYLTYFPVPEGKLLTFRVTALDVVGNESYGNYLRFYTEKYSRPLRLAGATVTFDTDNRDLIITWEVQPDTADIQLEILYDDLDDEYIGDQYLVNTYIGRTERYVYEDAELSTKYTIRLTPYNDQGTAGPTSTLVEVTVIPTDIPPPAVPVSLRARAGDRQVLLTWGESPSLSTSYFRLYRKTGTTTLVASDWTLIDEMPRTIHRFWDYGLTNDQVYSYYITSVDVYGRESLHLVDGHMNLNFVQTTPKQEGIITEPDNLQATLIGTNVLLTWDSLLEEFDGFTIYRSQNNLHSWEILATVDRDTLSYQDTGVPLIDGTIWYYTVDKTISDAEIVVQSTSVAPENAICIGELSLGGADFEDDADVSCRRDIGGLVDPLAEYTNTYLLPHRHRETQPFDPERIDLNPELIVTDWVSVDGARWTTQQDIDGTTFLLKVNGRFPNVFFEIHASLKEILFSEPLSDWENAEIELRVLGVEEVQNILDEYRFDNIHARQVQYGTLNLEQLPEINHEGRIREELLPKRFLLERYDNNTFVVPQLSTDSSKNFGTGTAFFAITESDGQIQEVIDFDLEDDGALVAFQRPSYSTDTILNLKQSVEDNLVEDGLDTANYYQYQQSYLYGIVPSNLDEYGTQDGTLSSFHVTFLNQLDVGSSNLLSGFSTVDYYRNKYYHLEQSTGMLFEFDPATGRVLRSVQIDLAPYQYDFKGVEVAEGTMYLVASDTGVYNRRLFAINTNTGVTTEIGTAVSNFDPRAIVYVDDDVSATHEMYIYGANLATLNLVWGTLDLTNNTVSSLGTPSTDMQVEGVAYHLYDKKIYAIMNNPSTSYELYQWDWAGFPPLTILHADQYSCPTTRTLMSPEATGWYADPESLHMGDYKGLLSDAFVRFPLNVPLGAAIGQCEITFTATSPATEIIVDDSDTDKFNILYDELEDETGGAEAYYTVESDSSAYGGSHHYFNTVPGDPTSAAEWRPTIVQAGKYEVHVYYVAGSDRVHNAPFTINHAGGSATVTVDQTVNGSTWVNLGAYEFESGTSGSVSITNAAGTGVVIADAIKFVHIMAAPSRGDRVDLEISMLDPTGLSDGTNLSSIAMASVSTLGSITWSPEPWSVGQRDEDTTVDVTELVREYVTRDDYWQGKHIIFKVHTINTTTEGHYRSAYSFGSSNAPILTASYTRDLAEVNSDPGGFQSEKSYHFNFEFADSQPTRWVRITTENTPIKPNPILDLEKRLRFKVLLPSGSLYLGLGIRELTGSDYQIGSDGGTSGPIEWASVDTIVTDDSGNEAPRGVLIEASSNWQEIDIDIPRSSITAFSDDADSKLPRKGFGVLEHLALTVNPDDTSPTGPFDLYIDKIEQVSDLIVAGSSQGIILSRDFGTTWTNARYTDTPVHRFYKARTNSYIWALSTTEVFIAVDPAYWFKLSGTVGVQNIRDIAEDDEGNIYVSTDKGVYFFEIALIRSFASFKQTRPVTPFTSECYGLYTYQVSSGVSEIWASTEIGVFKTVNQGLTWVDTGMDTAGLICYKFINIGTDASPNIIGVTRKHVVRKLGSASNFEIIANFEVQHGIYDIWTMAYFNGRLYVSTGSGVYANSEDGLFNSAITDIAFEKVFEGPMEVNGHLAVAFCLQPIQTDNRWQMFIGQENRLLVANTDHSVSIKTNYRNRDLPSFFINDEEVNIGYVYNAFNNVVVFREPRSVLDIVSAAYLPRRVWVAKEGGWAQTNPDTEIFIYKNGFPAWLDFALDVPTIQGEVQLIKDALSPTPNLTTFNSLYPQSQTEMNSLLTAIDALIASVEEDTIITFLEHYTRFLSLITESLADDLGLDDARIMLKGIPKDDRPAGSRATILEQKENFESENSVGININAFNGEVDFITAYSGATTPEARDAYSFDKYDKMEITAFNTQIANTGEYTHRELEDRAEEVNSGLPSHMGRAANTNLIKTGIFLESQHHYLFDRFNVSNIQSQFYAAYRNDWYDMVNSTVDYKLLVSVSDYPEPRFSNSAVIFLNDPYFAGKIWIGTDNDIVQYGFDSNGELVLENVIRPGSDAMFIWDIYMHKETEIYVVAADKVDLKSHIYISYNFGLTWEEVDTINLPTEVNSFRIINGIRVATTGEGVFYNDNDFYTWYPSTVVPRTPGSPAVEALTTQRVWNIDKSTFLIAEADRYFFTSQSGIEFFSPNGRLTNNDASIINDIMRFKNLTWVATDRGLYNDSNSILSDSVAFKHENEMEDSSSESASLEINCLTHGEEAVYCCATNGKVYRYLDADPDDDIGNEWLAYSVPDFGPIHRIILYEGTEKHYLVAISYNKIKSIDVTPETGVFG
jgi:fibronectin type 3 domain-containing protein